MQGRQGQPTYAHVNGDVVQPVLGSPYADWQDDGDAIALEQVQWLPPVLPSKVIVLWKNFHALAIKQNQSIPEEPLYALRAPSRSVGSLTMRPGTDVEIEIDGLGVLSNRYG